MAHTGLLNQIWQIILQVLPYLLLLLLHHFLLAPLLFRKKASVYIPLVLVLLTVFGFYCFTTGHQRDFREGPPVQFQAPPGQFQGPPPPMPMDNMMPPPPDRQRPMRPEAMRLLIGILLIGVDLGIMAYIRNVHAERQVQDLKAQNKENREKLEEMSRNAENVQKAESDLFFKTDYKQVRVKPDNILFIEGMGEYLKIYHLDATTPLVVLLNEVYPSSYRL